ncbi:MAG: hypothetical protein IKM74_07385 [Bacteroidales bacterium]|nr:hypothetical protein [Bacteroidales bacterium]
MNETQNDTFNSKYLCRLLMRYRKSILIVLVVAALLAIFFSSPWFITPLYKSSVILYPTSSNSISKVLISTTFKADKDILEFGETEQTEQMLQVLNSDRIRNIIIERHNLMDHYGIKPTQKYPVTKLNKLYDKRIKFRKTEYNAVKISVMDADPELAARIANDISDLYDSTMNAMQKEVAIKAFELVEAEYNSLCAEMAALEDSLNVLRSHGVFDYESQVEMLSQQLAVELGKGNNQGVKNIQNQLDILAKYGGAYYAISEKLDHERLQLSLVKTKYEEAKVDATQEIPHKFVVNTASPAEQKDFPKRILIVFLTVFATFLIMFMLLGLFDRYGSFFHEEANGGQNKAQKKTEDR